MTSRASTTTGSSTSPGKKDGDPQCPPTRPYVEMPPQSLLEGRGQQDYMSSLLGGNYKTRTSARTTTTSTTTSATRSSRTTTTTSTGTTGASRNGRTKTKRNNPRRLDNDLEALAKPNALVPDSTGTGTPSADSATTLTSTLVRPVAAARAATRSSEDENRLQEEESMDVVDENVIPPSEIRGIANDKTNRKGINHRPGGVLAQGRGNGRRTRGFTSTFFKQRGGLVGSTNAQSLEVQPPTLVTTAASSTTSAATSTGIVDDSQNGTTNRYSRRLNGDLSSTTTDLLHNSGTLASSGSTTNILNSNNSVLVPTATSTTAASTISAAAAKTTGLNDDEGCLEEDSISDDHDVVPLASSLSRTRDRDVNNNKKNHRQNCSSSSISSSCPDDLPKPLRDEIKRLVPILNDLKNEINNGKAASKYGGEPQQVRRLYKIREIGKGLLCMLKDGETTFIIYEAFPGKHTNREHGKLQSFWNTQLVPILEADVTLEILHKIFDKDEKHPDQMKVLQHYIRQINFIKYKGSSGVAIQNRKPRNRGGRPKKCSDHEPADIPEPATKCNDLKPTRKPGRPKKASGALSSGATPETTEATSNGATSRAARAERRAARGTKSATTTADNSKETAAKPSRKHMKKVAIV